MKRLLYVVFLFEGAYAMQPPGFWKEFFLGNTYALCDRIRAVDCQKMDVNACDSQGNTVMHYIASDMTNQWRPYIIQMLHEKGVYINHKNDEGDTPLICAVRNGKFDLARKLLQAGAQADAQNNAGQTALHCLFSKPAYVKKLNTAIEQCYDLRDKGTITCLATIKCIISKYAGNFECVPTMKNLCTHFFSECSVDDFIDYMQQLPPTLCEEIIADRLFSPRVMDDEWPLLKKAVREYSSDCQYHSFLMTLKQTMLARERVNKAESINIQDAKGNTALHYAADYAACYELLSYMIELGAERSVLNKDNKKPYHVFRINQCRCPICLIQSKNCQSYTLLSRPDTVLHSVMVELEHIQRKIIDETTNKYNNSCIQ